MHYEGLQRLTTDDMYDSLCDTLLTIFGQLGNEDDLIDGCELHITALVNHSARNIPVSPLARITSQEVLRLLKRAAKKKGTPS